MNNNVEDELDKMINELNAVNDEFVNNYFDEEESKNNRELLDSVEELNKTEEPKIEFDMSLEPTTEENKIEEQLQQKEEEKSNFSYSEILSRLDNNEKNIDINDTNDLLKLIDKTATADEFFDKIEEAINND